jgi:protein-tyrosine kinase
MLTTLGFDEQTLNVLYDQIDKLSVPTLAITSAEVGEGKTTLSLALAQYAARDKKRVLMIDFNSLNPTLTQLCKAANDVQNDWRVLKTQPSGINGIDILPAPRDPHLIFQLTKTQTLSELLKEHNAYDQIILDCPAVNSESGQYIPAAQICSVAKGTLLVVLSGKTVLAQIEQAMLRLSRDGANVFGAIMNDVKYSNLLTELTRETHRLDKYLPNAMSKVRAFLKKQTILNIDI